MTELGTVMVIDDEDIDQKQYRRLLERSGMVQEIMQFTYADTALAWLQDNPDKRIDVIFLDINMPRMNGFQFLDALEEWHSQLNINIILMLTTSLAPKDKDRATSHRLVKGFLSKPLLRQHLQDAADMVNGLRAGT